MTPSRCGDGTASCTSQSLPTRNLSQRGTVCCVACRRGSEGGKERGRGGRVRWKCARACLSHAPTRHTHSHTCTHADGLADSTRGRRCTRGNRHRSARADEDAQARAQAQVRRRRRSRRQAQKTQVGRAATHWQAQYTYAGRQTVCLHRTRAAPSRVAPSSAMQTLAAT